MSFPWPQHPKLWDTLVAWSHRREPGDEVYRIVSLVVLVPLWGVAVLGIVAAYGVGVGTFGAAAYAAFKFVMWGLGLLGLPWW